MDQHLDCARVALSDEAAKTGFKVGLDDALINISG